MPRYFLHLYEDDEVLDPQGMEASGIEAALVLASQEARNIAAQTAVQSDRIVLTSRIDIADQDGRVLDSVKFGDVLEIVT